jgi:hypothetical protein
MMVSSWLMVGDADKGYADKMCRETGVLDPKGARIPCRIKGFESVTTVVIGGGIY